MIYVYVKRETEEEVKGEGLCLPLLRCHSRAWKHCVNWRPDCCIAKCDCYHAILTAKCRSVTKGLFGFAHDPRVCRSACDIAIKVRFNACDREVESGLGVRFQSLNQSTRVRTRWTLGKATRSVNSFCHNFRRLYLSFCPFVKGRLCDGIHQTRFKI